MEKVVVRCPRCREVVREIDRNGRPETPPRECLCRRKTERVDMRKIRERLALTATAILVLAGAVAAQEAEIKIEAASGKGFAKLVARSATYEIRTDAGEESAKLVARMLEDLHRGFVTEFAKQLVGEDKPLKVSIYATYQSFAKANPMAGMGAGGFYDPGSKRLHVPMKQPGPDDWKMVLKHEGTHQLLHQRLGIGGGQPGQTSAIWFNEGFASYWATARWDGQKLVTGDAHAMLLKEFRRMQKAKELMSLKSLIGGQPNPMQMRAYYAQGWALCHFLRHGPYREKFAAYVESERKGGISLEAFKKAFGVEDLDAFEKQLLEHVDGLK